MLALFVVNIYATVLAFNKKLNKPWYGGWQIAAVWILPVIGAISTCFNTLTFPGLVNPTEAQCHAEVVKKSSAPTWLINCVRNQKPIKKIAGSVERAGARGRNEASASAKH